MKLQQKLIEIQSELKAPKSRFNSFGKYNYRSCEDILDAVKPLCKKHGLLLTIKDQTKELAGVIFIDSEVVISDGENSISVTAQAGIDVNKKGMDLSQCFGSSSSYARKYALNGMFCIDDNKDADSDEHKKQSESKSNKQPDKPVITPGSHVWNKAKQALLNKTVTIDVIRAKYIISKEDEDRLINELATEQLAKEGGAK